jgi:GT2 family glycosyltransferase
MNAMVYGIATRFWDGWSDCVESWQENATSRYRMKVVADLAIPQCFESIYRGTEELIISLIHDDLMIYERGWDERVLHQFDDPEVGVVGFAGGKGHFLPQAYREPFHIPNMIRRDFISNLRDAERHGQRFTGECDIAVLDGMALFVRRELLDKWGGWIHPAVNYWMYSESLCCEARRQGYRICLVGIDCDHRGGKTVGRIPLHEDYTETHRLFWEQNRDVLPFHVEGK